jgi:hypothetical protein
MSFYRRLQARRFAKILWLASIAPGELKRFADNAETAAVAFDELSQVLAKVELKGNPMKEQNDGAVGG